MSLNEVDWAGLLQDTVSFPPDLEIVVHSSDLASSVLQQRFFCHKLLLSAASPVFLEMFRWIQHGEIFQMNHTNPEAFQKVINFIYHKKPVSVHNRGSGSSIGLIKLVLDVLSLAARFKMKKLVRFCESVVEDKVKLSPDNVTAVQEVLLSNPEVSEKARGNIILKYKLMIRRQLVRSCSSEEELQ